jgi:hypothetical protein
MWIFLNKNKSFFDVFYQQKISLCTFLWLSPQKNYSLGKLQLHLITLCIAVPSGDGINFSSSCFAGTKSSPASRRGGTKSSPSLRDAKQLCGEGEGLYEYCCLNNGELPLCYGHPLWLVVASPLWGRKAQRAWLVGPGCRFSPLGTQSTEGLG